MEARSRCYRHPTGGSGAAEGGALPLQVGAPAGATAAGAIALRCLTPWEKQSQAPLPCSASAQYRAGHESYLSELLLAQ
ncbi:hypothetical protein C4D60_Mb06t20080 [Musa balbisiana]|uniref:Uncharacterized protein n=1 Tax=Musa balbisiana TaxID=52838 RepID=A0A4S8IPF3_MUSBA|nr:hypothetical protein C4D60_Mb06t20080 [Musa balbisiana]